MVEWNNKDFIIESYRSPNYRGSSDNAVRITYLPTGALSVCGIHKSYTQNFDVAKTSILDFLNRFKTLQQMNEQQKTPEDHMKEMASPRLEPAPQDLFVNHIIRLGPVDGQQVIYEAMLKIKEHYAGEANRATDLNEQCNNMVNFIGHTRMI